MKNIFFMLSTLFLLLLAQQQIRNLQVSAEPDLPDSTFQYKVDGLPTWKYFAITFPDLRLCL